MFRIGCFQGWFAMRRDLPRGRRGLLAVCSFVLPLLMWCVVSYVPGIWHPDVKLTLAAGTERMTAVFTAGNRVSADFFPQYVEAVRRDNEDIVKARESAKPASGAKRSNRLLLRQLVPVALGNGWLKSDQEQDDAAIFRLWGELATGVKIARKPALTDENLAIVRANWATLKASSTVFDYARLPDEPLL
ncbi:MAG TPA: hypothetical protein VIM57_05620, partial [Luteolibacter sp.]